MRTIWRRWCLAKCLSCRTEVRAIGVDPSRVWLNRAWTRFVMNTMTNFISVRDADSQRVLETMGVYRRIFPYAGPGDLSASLPIDSGSQPKASEDVPRMAWAISPQAQLGRAGNTISAFCWSTWLGNSTWRMIFWFSSPSRTNLWQNG